MDNASKVLKKYRRLEKLHLISCTRLVQGRRLLLNRVVVPCQQHDDTTDKKEPQLHAAKV